MFGLILAATVGGPFPLLMTPYSENGDLDCETLAREAAFVADCGANGIIWPSAGDALKYLSDEEERLGLEAIADALDGRDVCFTPCCPGTNTADAVRRLGVAEAIAAKHPKLPMATLVRLVDGAKTDADHRRHYEQVATATRHPVIIQTYNGRSPKPSVRLLVDLARRHPDVYGWYKVEGSEKSIAEYAAELVAAKPVVKTVFTGWGGRDLLYHFRQIGTRGVITQRPSYADLIAKCYRALETGSPEADELFMKILLLRNLDDALPEKDMRGWHMHALMRRGVFRNALSRTVCSNGVWRVARTELSPAQVAEMEYRMRACGIDKPPKSSIFRKADFPLDMPFSTWGSLFAVTPHDRNDWGAPHEAGVWLRNVSYAGASGYVAQIVPLVGGQPTPVTGIVSEVGLLRVETAAGAVEVALSGANVALLRTTSPKLGLKLDFGHGAFWQFAWEVPTATGRTAVVLPLFTNGARIVLDVRRGEKKVDCSWDGWSAQSAAVEVAPSSKGFEIALKDSFYEWDGRPVDVGFDQAVAEARSSFASFLAKMPSVPAEFAETRERAARLLWSAVMAPCGRNKRPSMLMSKNWMNQVWSWDHCFNAMALAYGDADAAWDQLMGMFDHQAPTGQLPDSFNGAGESWTFVKPPIHGWALARMMKANAFGTDRLAEAYERLSKWTDWWTTCRDADRNGLCEYHHGNDSGWDNSTAFRQKPPLETPELQAYLAVQMDVLAELAARLGRTADAAAWKAKAAALDAKAAATLFDAEGRPLVRRVLDGATDRPATMLTRLAMLRGARLPEKSRRKLVEEVKSDLFRTDWGLATESPSSRDYRPDGYWLGPIWAPETMLAVDGLKACGEPELARDLALKFCRMCRKSGFAENFDARTGEPLRDRAYTWTASVFLVLAHELR